MVFSLYSFFSLFFRLFCKLSIVSLVKQLLSPSFGLGVLYNNVFGVSVLNSVKSTDSAQLPLSSSHVLQFLFRLDNSNLYS